LAGKNPYLSAAEVARQLGLPPSTVRYYRDQFADYITTDKHKRLDPESVEVVQIVADLYKKGNKRNDIERHLGDMYGHPVPAIINYEQQQQQATTQQQAQERLAKALETLSDQKQRQDILEQRQEDYKRDTQEQINKMEKRLIELESMLNQKNHRRNKKPWWKIW